MICFFIGFPRGDKNYFGSMNNLYFTTYDIILNDLSVMHEEDFFPSYLEGDKC
jgi:hypothetical protein